MNRETSHFDSRGMTLIEVLIALGVMSIMSMATMSLIQSQSRETRALTEKMAALDFQRTVEGAISVAASCGKNVSVGNLASGQSLTFNPASITSTNKNKPQVIANLKDVYGMDGSTVLIDTTSANRVVSALSDYVKLRANTGLQLGAYKDPTSGQLVYQLLLSFDGSTLTRPIHNLAMTINATTLPAGGSNIQVTGCIGASAPVAPTVPTGTICGNRLVACPPFGASNVSYDGQAYAWNGSPIQWSAGTIWKSSNIPCQGVSLTAACQPATDPSGYWIGSFVSAIYGCPSGWSGAHTMVGDVLASEYTNPSLAMNDGSAYSNVDTNQEIGYIYCVKN